MAHDSVINAFNEKLRQKEVDNLLASNVVLDWFGRTICGRQRVVDYYLNTSNTYDHILTNVESAQPFESRSAHMMTRREPEENFSKSADLSSDEQWFDCEASSSLDLKKVPYKTPTINSTSNTVCPPAPCRKSLIYSSDEEVDTCSEDEIELGIYPLDSTVPLPFKYPNKKKVTKEQHAKRSKLGGETNEELVPEQAIMEQAESNYSELNYLETTGTVIIRKKLTNIMSDTEETDRRECKLFISWRVNKNDQNDIQLALIVYKSINPKSRRNLLNEFKESKDKEIEAVEITPSAGLFYTAVKDNPKKLDDSAGTASEPHNGKKQKASKRRMNIRRLLF